jgi:hypothetical protein
MYTMTFEPTDEDRVHAFRLAEELDGAIGPATRLRILERGLAHYRSELSAEVVKLSDELAPTNDFWKGYIDGLRYAVSRLRGRSQ